MYRNLWLQINKKAMEAAGYFLCRDRNGIEVLSGQWLLDFTLSGLLVLTYPAFYVTL
jgi:hypothetical protein